MKVHITYTNGKKATTHNVQRVTHRDKDEPPFPKHAIVIQDSGAFEVIEAQYVTTITIEL
jgi:hypothetical protein